MILRGYQRRLRDGALNLWAEHRRIAVVLATGGGKTVVFSDLARLALQQGPVLILAHRVELLEQAVDKMRQHSPDVSVGIMDGTRKQHRADVVAAGIGTATSKASMPYILSRRWSLVIIDECHHAAADSYVRLLRELGAYRPDGPLVLGATATLTRGDGLALGEIFEAVVEPQIGLIDLLRDPEGPFLVPPRGIRVRIAELDLSKVRRVAGDFSGKALGQAMSDAMAPQRIVDAWTEHAKGRQTIAFLPSVAISREVAVAFADAGHAVAHMDDKTPKGERRAILERYRAGEVTVLCNVGLFREGTDLPSTSCIIMGAPTSSPVVYQQEVGRGLRLHPGKKDCIVLDITGVTGRHKLATLVSLDGAARPGELPDDLLMYEEDEPEPLPELDLTPDEPDEDVTAYADGDLEHELIDLFGQSHSAWQRTDGGRWFLAAGHAGYLYLAPRPGDRWDLRYVTPGGASGTMRDDMEIGYAMQAGDEVVAQNPVWQADRNAAWRAGARAERMEARMRREASRLIDTIV